MTKDEAIKEIQDNIQCDSRFCSKDCTYFDGNVKLNINNTIMETPYAMCVLTDPENPLDMIHKSYIRTKLCKALFKED